MLYINKNIREAIIDDAIKGSPNEICGILGGQFIEDNKNVRRTIKNYHMINRDRSPKSFFMEPGEQLKVMKDMRKEGLEMVSVYHSHPATKAYPSAHDVKMAYYPDISYIIISLENKDKPYMRSFNIIEGSITEEEIIVENE